MSQNLFLSISLLLSLGSYTLALFAMEDPYDPERTYELDSNSEDSSYSSEEEASYEFFEISQNPPITYCTQLVKGDSSYPYSLYSEKTHEFLYFNETDVICNDSNDVNPNTLKPLVRYPTAKEQREIKKILHMKHNKPVATKALDYKRIENIIRKIENKNNAKAPRNKNTKKTSLKSPRHVALDAEHTSKPEIAASDKGKEKIVKSYVPRLLQTIKNKNTQETSEIVKKRKTQRYYVPRKKKKSLD